MRASIKKGLPDSSISVGNTWNKLNSLPACRLRNVIPGKIIEKDRIGIQNILAKVQELDKLKNWNESAKQNKRNESRLAVMNRHNELKQLELKCGIEKIRDKSLSEGNFGYIKLHKVTKRTEELSKPRTAGKGSRYDPRDFRGLLHADFSEAIAKIDSAANNAILNKSKNTNKRVEKKEEMRLSEFEYRVNEKEILKESSIDVSAYDMAQEFFQME